jgi:hypothetical protein
MESLYDRRFKNKQVLEKSHTEKTIYRRKYYAENREKVLQYIKASKTRCSVCEVEIRKSGMKDHELSQQHLTNLWMHEDEDFMAWIKDITKRVLEHQHLFREQLSSPFRICFD